MVTGVVHLIICGANYFVEGGVGKNLLPDNNIEEKGSDNIFDKRFSRNGAGATRFIGVVCDALLDTSNKKSTDYGRVMVFSVFVSHSFFFEIPSSTRILRA